MQFCHILHVDKITLYALDYENLQLLIELHEGEVIIYKHLSYCFLMTVCTVLWILYFYQHFLLSVSVYMWKDMERYKGYK